MPRQMRFIVLISILVLATLACNAITQPFNQAKDAVATVESLATAMPVETLMAIPSMLPSEMPSFDLTSVPGFDATSLPDVVNCFDPQSEPLKEWKDIPIMPKAIVGEECSDMYIFKVNGKPEDVKAYYDEALSALGWQNFPGMGDTGAGGLFLMYQKDNGFISVIVTPSTDGANLQTVMLTRG